MSSESVAFDSQEIGTRLQGLAKDLSGCLFFYSVEPGAKDSQEANRLLPLISQLFTLINEFGVLIKQKPIEIPTTTFAQGLFLASAPGRKLIDMRVILRQLNLTKNDWQIKISGPETAKLALLMLVYWLKLYCDPNAKQIFAILDPNLLSDQIITALDNLAAAKQVPYLKDSDVELFADILNQIKRTIAAEQNHTNQIILDRLAEIHTTGERVDTHVVVEIVELDDDEPGDADAISQASVRGLYEPDEDHYEPDEDHHEPEDVFAPVYIFIEKCLAECTELLENLQKWWDNLIETDLFDYFAYYAGNNGISLSKDEGAQAPVQQNEPAVVPVEVVVEQPKKLDGSRMAPLPFDLAKVERLPAAQTFSPIIPTLVAATCLLIVVAICYFFKKSFSNFAEPLPDFPKAPSALTLGRSF